ncbi:MAG: hypothetical protein IJ418_09170 [Clostridia bacterium]|nr:hypothetical protein [Clostridia bacterium]
MNNILRFPSPPRMQQPQQPRQGQPGQQRAGNPMQAIMDRFMSGMRPEQILDQMEGPEVRQARQIIHGKSPAQLKSIARNMAAQRGVKLEELAAQMGIRLPE